MRRFVEGINRGQATLFPECLEDWIDADNPVRVIDAFVEKLDLSGLGFEEVAPEATGRPFRPHTIYLTLPNGGAALPNEAIAQGRHRDGTPCPCLQSNPRAQHHGHTAVDGGDPIIVKTQGRSSPHQPI